MGIKLKLLKPNKYECAVCKEVYKKVLTDKEAGVQADYEFPGWETEECGIVCDDCFKVMFPKGT